MGGQRDKEGEGSCVLAHSAELGSASDLLNMKTAKIIDS